MQEGSKFIYRREIGRQVRCAVNRGQVVTQLMRDLGEHIAGKRRGSRSKTSGYGKPCRSNINDNTAYMPSYNSTTEMLAAA